MDIEATLLISLLMLRFKSMENVVLIVCFVQQLNYEISDHVEAENSLINDKWNNNSQHVSHYHSNYYFPINAKALLGTFSYISLWMSLFRISGRFRVRAWLISYVASGGRKSPTVTKGKCTFDSATAVTKTATAEDEGHCQQSRKRKRSRTTSWDATGNWQGKCQLCRSPCQCNEQCDCKESRSTDWRLSSWRLPNRKKGVYYVGIKSMQRTSQKVQTPRPSRGRTDPDCYKYSKPEGTSGGYIISLWQGNRLWSSGDKMGSPRPAPRSQATKDEEHPRCTKRNISEGTKRLKGRS